MQLDFSSVTGRVYMPIESYEDMENYRPPEPRFSRASPKNALSDGSPLVDRGLIEGLAAGSIAKAAALYVDSCSGGDEYENNCAHFLSNAFILAGASDISSSHSCIEARCGTDEKRPIRARNMHCWFKEKATKTSTTIVKNDGFWAVFQLKESEYWGGHVAIIDSDNWKFYGTGWYEDWDQNWYKW